MAEEERSQNCWRVTCQIDQSKNIAVPACEVSSYDFPSEKTFLFGSILLYHNLTSRLTLQILNAKIARKIIIHLLVF